MDVNPRQSLRKLLSFKALRNQHHLRAILWTGVMTADNLLGINSLANLLCSEARSNRPRTRS